MRRVERFGFLSPLCLCWVGWLDGEVVVGEVCVWRECGGDLGVEA